MRRRIRHPHQPPPPLRGIAVDGANVIATARATARQRIEAVLDWAAMWRADLPVAMFFDHRTVARCPPEFDRWLAGLGAAGRVAVTVCPPGVAADAPLLQHAAAHHALVVSNDRFDDHRELRDHRLIVQFTVAPGRFTPHAEATWFRVPGQALRWPLDRLRP